VNEESKRHLTSLQQLMSNGGEVETVNVQLPRTGRSYRIALPTEDSRMMLFAQARERPGQPQPFWSQLWPSGVALADVLIPNSAALAGVRVLELGSGLGVTASVALESGALLTAVDYTELALSFCHYNTRMNTGRAPRTMALNWREPQPEALARLTEDGQFPIILAADVLYEGADIAPLIELTDSLLLPDGVLWLAEPGRKTAARFLLALAERGWVGTTEYSDGPWPNGAEVRVYVHKLQRPTQPDWLLSSLGGWRP